MGIEDLKEMVQGLSDMEKEELRKFIEATLVSVVPKKKRELGKYEGKIVISEDFNEPLPDFEDYTK